jgi:hypothetical protein
VEKVRKKGTCGGKKRVKGSISPERMRYSNLKNQINKNKLVARKEIDW